MRQVLSLALLLTSLALPTAAQTEIPWNSPAKFLFDRASIQQIDQACRGAHMAYIDSIDATPMVKDFQGNALTLGDSLAPDSFVQSTERLVPIFQTGFPHDRLIIVLASNN